MWEKLPQDIKDKLSDFELGQTVGATYVARAGINHLLEFVDGNEASDNLLSMSEWLEELEDELNNELKSRRKIRELRKEK